VQFSVDDLQISAKLIDWNRIDVTISDQHEELLTAPKKLLCRHSMLTFLAGWIVARLP
jgi:hypothetical protein